MTTSNGTVSTVIISDVPKTCYGDAGASIVCSDLSKPSNSPPNVCTDSTTAGSCHCEQTETRQQVGSTNPFPDPDPTKRGEYCITGNKLVVKEIKNLPSARPRGISRSECSRRSCP